MKERDVSRRTRRQDRLIREHIHDPYKLRRKLPEPTRCPQCGAVYQGGRWAWSKAPVPEAHEETCQACHRINDKYPAGEVQLHGSFVVAHGDEITRLARNAEQAENAEHPENRIMTIENRDDGMVITTTDVHLPHRIGHLLEETWEGHLAVHYDEEGYFSRVEWRRDG
jgi:NMD protein affecting ribosome stability and mRNA decay